MVLYIRARKLEHARIGITVSKKMGKAVVRNKIKRQIRMMCQEVFDFNEPYDVIVMIRHKYLDHTYQENLETLIKLRKKLVKTGEQHD